MTGNSIAIGPGTLSPAARNGSASGIDDSDATVPPERTTSHALGRLREHLGDPILVRVGSEMRPTPRAERLAPQVARLLRTASRMLADETAFSAETSERIFTLVAPDFVSAVLPSLHVALQTNAPNPTVELLPPGPPMWHDLAAGHVDLIVAPDNLDVASGTEPTPLTRLDWATFLRADHPATADWSLERWLEHRHVRVRTNAAGPGPVDLALEALGHQRRMGPTLSHFTMAPPLLAQTDLMLTVPRGVLADVADAFGLWAMPCPLSLPPIGMATWRATSLMQDPATDWFAGLTRDVLLRAFDTENAAPIEAGDDLAS